MRNMIFLVILLSAGLLLASQDKASPQELVDKCNEACKLIEAKGEEAFKTINDKNGRFVWKDTYVFVINSEKLSISAHPINADLIGKELSGLKDSSGRYWFAEMVMVGTKDGEGWVQYEWPKVGAQEVSNKVTYVKKVPGTVYIVAAGVYDYTKEEVEKLLKK